MKFPPGYYKISYQALTMGEVLRSRGWLHFPLAYLITRFKQPSPGGWMPRTWQELECTEQDLSERFFQAVAGYRQEFQRLGFTEVGFKRVEGFLSPIHRDNGGINFLDASRRHFGQLIYSKTRVPQPVNVDRERVVIAFTAEFKKQTFSCTNNRIGFNGGPGHKTIRYKSNNIADIYQQFCACLNRRRETPRQFSDTDALRAWFNQNADDLFQIRVQRKLFIPMTEQEVQSARLKIPPPLPKKPDNSGKHT
jgi:hypothetical protein